MINMSMVSLSLSYYFTSSDVSARMFRSGIGEGVHFYGKHSGVICFHDADGCDDGGGDSESSIG